MFNFLKNQFNPTDQNSDQEQEEHPIVLALEIGSKSIKAVSGCYNQNREIEILGIGKASTIGIKEGKIFNPKKVAEAIRNVLLKLTDEENLGILENLDLVVGISGTYIKNHKIVCSHNVADHGGVFSNNLSTSGKTEIQDIDVKLLKDRAGKEVFQFDDRPIHAYPQKFKVDNNYDEFSEKEIIGMVGHKISCAFNVISADRDGITNLENALKQHKMSPSCVVVKNLANANAFVSTTEKELGTASIHIGSSSINIVIFSQGLLKEYICIPFGADELTYEIHRVFKIPTEWAENAKVNGAEAMITENFQERVLSLENSHDKMRRQISTKSLTKVVEARLMDIIEMISVRMKEVGYDNKNLSFIFLSGGGANLNNIEKLFEKVLGIETRVLKNPDGIVHSNNLLDETHKAITSPEYTTAIALLKIALENNTIKKKERDFSPEKKKNKKSGGVSFFDPIQKRIDNLLRDVQEGDSF